MGWWKGERRERGRFDREERVGESLYMGEFYRMGRGDGRVGRRRYAKDHGHSRRAVYSMRDRD